MGVGKTTTCRILRDRLDKCVFLDGDWCWDMHPFVVNAETKAMVLDNICHLLNNFLQCGFIILNRNCFNVLCLGFYEF